MKSLFATEKSILSLDHLRRHLRSRSRILIVEDNRPVAAILSRILERQGYQVTLAVDGDEALERFGSDGPFGLLITDLVLPGGLNGLSLIRELQRRQRSLPVILLTGYPVMAEELGLNERKDLHLLMKPVPIAELTETVSSAVSSRSSFF